MNNPLRDCGKPSFFKVADAAALGFTSPHNRKGQAVRAAVRALAGMQKEALVASSATGTVWRLACDEGAYLNGSDEAPCPLSFLTTGMVASYMEEIRALARLREIELRDVKLLQDNYYAIKGSALRGTMQGAARDIELEAQIDSPAGHGALQALVLDAVTASPLNGLMRGRKESLFSLVHNGRKLALGAARPVTEPTPPDPSDLFERAMPAAGDWSNLIVRQGMTPKTAETVTLAGDSLKEEQDRILHVRGICTLLPNGMKSIEQHLYNPHGSIFRFLSEEGAQSGRQGRAPDAVSYISAGIAFCFLTQLGRYAKIVRKTVDRYACVQDTHFSLGGASARTGKPGEADPVETHLYVDSPEVDDFARAALDMSEQTCYLHAFCKTDLKAKVKVVEHVNAA
jgi:hypothetical protein